MSDDDPGTRKEKAMRTLGGLGGRLRHLGRDRGGAVAVWFGLAAVMLLFFAGSGLDLARSVNLQAEMQGAADAAALAGASAYTGPATAAAAAATATNYMTQFKTTSGLASLTFTVTPGTATSGSSVSTYSMTVKATSPITNTLMAMAKQSNTVSVTATAQNPVYNVTISLSNFSSSAVDTDSISYYTVPADGSVPPTASTTLIFSNAVNTPTSKAPLTIPLTASQKLGFMLTNVTDGNATSVQTCTTILFFQTCSSKSNSYGNNGYGGTPGSTHLFYSHLMPPSKAVYPSVMQNCGLQVLTSASAKPTSGTCFNALPAYATVNCVQSSGMTLYFYWNDMGGTTDDKDYNDAVYTVTCSQVGSGAGKGLMLTN